MSETPRNHEMHIGASDELEKRARGIVEKVRELAIAHAATEPGRVPHLREIVEREHVVRAVTEMEQFIDSLISRAYAKAQGPSDSASDAPSVFISYSSKDDQFISQLAAQLQDKGVSCFFAKQTIRPSAEWKEQIWVALRQCRVVLFVITAQSIKSNWCKYEIGACLRFAKANHTRAAHRRPRIAGHFAASSGHADSHQKTGRQARSFPRRDLPRLMLFWLILYNEASQDAGPFLARVDITEYT